MDKPANKTVTNRCVGAVLTAILYYDAAPFAVETAPTDSDAALVGAVLTAIFYYDAAPFAVETAPTGFSAALV